MDSSTSIRGDRLIWQIKTDSMQKKMYMTL